MLKPSNDSKVEFHSGHGNSLGLMPGETCPGKTTGPGGCSFVKEGGKRVTCYVRKFLDIRPTVKNLLKHNTELLKSANDGEKYELLNGMIEGFKNKELKREKPEMHFRLHWSGDLFDASYAKALALVVRKHKDVNFWMYTRSFDLIPDLLLKCGNLSLYLSSDPCNAGAAEKAVSAIRKKKGVKARIRLAHLHPEDPKNGAVPCPADIGTIKKAGACMKCRLCVNGSADVWFKC